MPSAIRPAEGSRRARRWWRRPPIAGLLVAWCMSATAHAAVINVACVGDSITYGSGSSDPATKSYPAVLAGLLGSGYAVGNFGHGGTTMLKRGDFPYWNVTEYPASDAFAPNIVVIMLGTNDSKPQNWKFSDHFVGDDRALIEHYRNLPSHPLVFSCTVCPVYGSGNFGITSPVVQNGVIPHIIHAATVEAAPLIDINAAMSGIANDFPDNVHPNDAGYVQLANAVYRSIHPPAAASALSATAITGHRIDLAWTDNADNETGFAIERKTGAGGVYAVVATAATNATVFSDTTVAGLTTYYYRVRALNASGSAGFTNEATATTPVAPASSARRCGHGAHFGSLLLLIAGLVRGRGMRADARRRSADRSLA